MSASKANPAMSAPKAVLIKGPSVNSRVYMTELPDQHEALLAKAQELFHVPPDHTPYLCVAAPAVSGSPVSDARGAILMPDAMKFLRDREIITLRWSPSSPRRTGNRVHWDSQLEYDTPVPEQRGAEYRMNHAARTLERERRAALLLSPTKSSQQPMSPPPSSPDGPEDVPGSPTPVRGGNKSLWLDEYELAEKDAAQAKPSDTESQPSKESRSRLSSLWQSVFSPFSKAEPTAEQIEEAEAAEAVGIVPSETEIGAAAEQTETPLQTVARPSQSTIDTMTKVLNGVREHPCNAHLRERMPEEFMRYSAQRGRAVDLHTISERIEQNNFPAGAALGHFVKDLTIFWDNVKTFYGPNTVQAQEAASLGRFATMLLGELQRPQTKRVLDSDDDSVSAGAGAANSHDNKRARRGLSTRASYAATRRTATR
ncbi:hypothetical protein MCUN1_000493 [Malassezia cuniculi]|uniref:Bromo domain-containing protein n=1 Tax=Malassezia cuniculi TaxID=948313 RepID=A0AAF0ERB8_9BASI|nr:hypothetical protein MCUN1_000493 [Malassezia cuniculi]